jgi:carbamoyl-phosphate synthase large subunit
MFITHSEQQLKHTVREAFAASPDHPVLIDRFLEDAFEVDVDAICDGERTVVAGIMQHIEQAGVHSGDSACVIPPHHKKVNKHLDTLREYTHQLAIGLGVRGLMNVQFAIKDDVVFVLEVNPRASRTVPFVAKATGVPLAAIAAKVMAGRSLEELGLTEEPKIHCHFVKEAVLPFMKFTDSDPILGPEMKSTGEVMGVGDDFGMAFAKAQYGAGTFLPQSGKAFLSVNDNDKETLVHVARHLDDLGFSLVATSGTAKMLRSQNIECETIFKIVEGRPNALDMIKNDELQMIINTPFGGSSYEDEKRMRRIASLYGIPLITTMTGAEAAIHAIESLRKGPGRVLSLQEIYAEAAGKATGESTISPAPADG